MHDTPVRSDRFFDTDDDGFVISRDRVIWKKGRPFGMLMDTERLQGVASEFPWHRFIRCQSSTSSRSLVGTNVMVDCVEKTARMHCDDGEDGAETCDHKDTEPAYPFIFMGDRILSFVGSISDLLTHFATCDTVVLHSVEDIVLSMHQMHVSIPSAWITCTQQLCITSCTSNDRVVDISFDEGVDSALTTSASRGNVCVSNVKGVLDYECADAFPHLRVSSMSIVPSPENKQLQLDLNGARGRDAATTDPSACGGTFGVFAVSANDYDITAKSGMIWNCPDGHFNRFKPRGPNAKCRNVKCKCTSGFKILYDITLERTATPEAARSFVEFSRLSSLPPFITIPHVMALRLFGSNARDLDSFAFNRKLLIGAVRAITTTKPCTMVTRTAISHIIMGGGAVVSGGSKSSFTCSLVSVAT